MKNFGRNLIIYIFFLLLMYLNCSYYFNSFNINDWNVIIKTKCLIFIMFSLIAFIDSL
jgi:hypothetical protein